MLYTLFSFHEKEDYHFSVIDKNAVLFDKFNIPECKNNPIKNNPIKNNIIPLNEQFIEHHNLNLEEFLNQCDLYTCYSGTSDLFSERAVNLLRDELKNEVEFIPCSIKGEKVKIYAALFLKSARMISSFVGMGFEFYPLNNVNAEYAIQDEKGVKFVTQKFVDLIEKHQLVMEFRAKN